MADKIRYSELYIYLILLYAITISDIYVVDIRDAYTRRSLRPAVGVARRVGRVGRVLTRHVSRAHRKAFTLHPTSSRLGRLAGVSGTLNLRFFVSTLTDSSHRRGEPPRWPLLAHTDTPSRRHATTRRACGHTTECPPAACPRGAECAGSRVRHPAVQSRDLCVSPLVCSPLSPPVLLSSLARSLARASLFAPPSAHSQLSPLPRGCTPPRGRGCASSARAGQ